MATGVPFLSGVLWNGAHPNARRHRQGTTAYSADVRQLEVGFLRKDRLIQPVRERHLLRRRILCGAQPARQERRRYGRQDQEPHRVHRDTSTCSQAMLTSIRRTGKYHQLTPA